VDFAAQWREIRAALPEDWAHVRLVATIAEEERANRAALLMGSLVPGRAGATFRLLVSRAIDPEHVFRRLDRDGIRGRLNLVDAEERERPAPPTEAPPRPPARERPLVEQWDELTARLPADWSDLYAEIELGSSDFLERGALHLAPVNPAHYGGPLTLRFRVASTKGYGAYAAMARRCFERLDADGITGRLRALRVLSRTSLVATQGPVWRVGGRAV
jgi:hypothetical protein